MPNDATFSYFPEIKLSTIPITLEMLELVEGEQQSGNALTALISFLESSDDIANDKGIYLH